MKKLITLVFIPLLFACFSAGTSDPARFYTLTPQTATRPAVVFPRPISIGIETVSIPGYIDRPQIVVRAKDSSEVVLSDFDRWAEGLRDALPRLIVQNMTVYASNVDAAVMRTINRTFDYRVVVDILQLDAVLGERAVLEASFFITDKTGKHQKQGRTFLSLPVDLTYADLARKESRLIAKLSNDIVTAVFSLEQKKP